VADRESDDSSVEIHASEADPDKFIVESTLPALEELAALYLFLTCGESIRSSERAIEQSAVDALRNKYHMELSRANDSIWHQSSAASPYPNLGDGVPKNAE